MMWEHYGPFPTVSHHAKKFALVGRAPRMYDTEKLVEAKHWWENFFHQRLVSKSDHVREELLDLRYGPVVVDVSLCWQHPKGTSKKLLNTVRPRWKRPDLSNLLKTIEDSMVRSGVINDDGQIAEIHIRKCDGPSPYVRVYVAKAVG